MQSIDSETPFRGTVMFPGREIVLLACIFISTEAAAQGVRLENYSAIDPLVTLRYFGPDVHRDMPEVGDHTRR